jgi:hypothetical protein
MVRGGEVEVEVVRDLRFFEQYSTGYSFSVEMEMAGCFLILKPLFAVCRGAWKGRR